MTGVLCTEVGAFLIALAIVMPCTVITLTVAIAIPVPVAVVITAATVRVSCTKFGGKCFGGNNLTISGIACCFYYCKPVI